MQVKGWMNNKPITVKPDDTVTSAFEFMQKKELRRLPVTNEANELVGMITRSDCLKVSPSPATTLSRHELNYLLEKIKVKDIMQKKVITSTPEENIEDVAIKLRHHRIHALPVVEGKKVVGYISESDIFDAFIDIMGVKSRGTRLLLELVDKQGLLAEIAQIVSEQSGNITSIAEVHRNDNNKVFLLIRFEASQEAKMTIIQMLEGFGHVIVEEKQRM